MSRAITILVDERVHDKLGEMARERGHSLTAYAKMLFEAAYAARLGKSGDMELDTLVGCVVVLWGAQKDTATIATTLKLKEATVSRIVSAWRKHVVGAA